MKPAKLPLSLPFLLCASLTACESSEDAAVDAAGAPDSAAGSEDAAGGDFCPVVGYTLCGGDLVATWSLRALCPDDPEAAAALCEHPYDDQAVCTGAGNEAICDSTSSGTLTFHSDQTIDIDVQISLVMTWNFTDACLEAVVQRGTTPEERCADLDSNDRQTCTYDGQCTCVSDPIVEGDNLTSTYTIVGDDLTIGEDPPATYCVDGDRLTMDYYQFHPVSWRYWVLDRE